MIVATIFACLVTGQCHNQEVRVEAKYCHYRAVPFEMQVGSEWVKGNAGVKCGGIGTQR